MEEYKIFFKKSVEKDLKKIPKKDLLKILKKIKALKTYKTPNGSEKLINNELYRVRQGSYRSLYLIEEKNLTINIIKIAYRSKIYKKL